ncbi:MAG: cysteine--tRNA ligase [Desulfobacterales bacterium]
MTLRVYNTLGRKKEIFEPIEPGKVRMYVCGPTVYDSCHIGHARSVVVFDVIVRYLEAAGYAVTYVRNFTDVDDKIIKRAGEMGIGTAQLAEKFIAEFYRDMDALNIRRATVEPRATEHIDSIIQVIERLYAKGLAYVVDGDVYFSVTDFADYGKLSGRKLEDMEAGARVDVDDRKRNPFDFALWKSAKPGEPSWESPWGRGRPGWHIECSAMSGVFLGESFDIHGGGKDLIFPHHENEIAQSEGAFGKPFAKYWIHNGFVNINQEKMSKSLGNFLMIRDVLESYHPECVRLFLLSNHYRSPIDFSGRAMDESTTALDKIYALMERFEGIPAAETSGALWNNFREAMDDDFNTARGIGIVFDAVRNLNRLLDENLDPASMSELQSAKADLLKIGDILGILQEPPKQYFEKKKSRGLEKSAVDPETIENLIAERLAARKSKNWARADEIRDFLAGHNIVLEDRPEGTVWKIKE